jgi:hypothetical protein
VSDTNTTSDFWLNLSTLLAEKWRHELILHLHAPEEWPEPSLADIGEDQRALAEEMRARHLDEQGNPDPEFTDLAETLAGRTRAMQEWERQHDAGDW